VFLPQGYPESVSDDYLEYQIWDTVQVDGKTFTQFDLIRTIFGYDMFK